MKLSIIIVNWNTGQLILDCLRSVFRDLTTSEVEVFVVDNASTDGSPQKVAGQFPQVMLVQNSENAGFARANNQALQRCQGEYIVFLNPDTEALPGALPALSSFLDLHPRVGACGPRLLNSDRSLQPSCSPSPTLRREIFRLFHLPFVRMDGYYEMSHWDISQPHLVDVLLGACLLVRKDVLDQIGPMDERFFIYSEEVDLCRRIQRAGWELMWVPTAQVIHHGGQSTQQVAGEMFLRLYEGKLAYFRKHYGRIAGWVYKAILFITAVSRLILAPFAWLEGNPRREKHLALASNYMRLMVSLPGM